MKRNFYSFLFLIIVTSCSISSNKTAPDNSEDFSFVFMTDIHLTEKHNAVNGLLQAIDTINKIGPDFVLTGGDNIMDALEQTFEKATKQYNLFEETMENLKMPYYSTMGNHEVFGLYEKSGIEPTHEMFGKKMYENELAQKYYSFDHKKYHFIVLDGIGFTEDRHYYGLIDSVQTEWLKQDLEKTGKEKPVIVSTHIPLLSVGSQVMTGPTEGFRKSSIITNAQEIVKILESYNTKLVLQGHLHFLEDINYNGIHYITAGAVSSNWWMGPRFGMEEGFVKVNITGENFNWEYIDFGWEIEN